LKSIFFFINIPHARRKAGTESEKIPKRELYPFPQKRGEQITMFKIGVILSRSQYI
jgi:hypothetical protein